MPTSLSFSSRTIQHLKLIQTLLDQPHPNAPPQALIVPDSSPPGAHIIVFPGSFNPPTTAHLALLRQARRFAQRQQAPIQLYAAISKHIVDKETIERPLLIDRIMLLDTVLHRHVRHAGIMLFNRGLYVEQAYAVYNSFPQVQQLFFLMGFDKIVQVLDPRYYTDRDAALRELFALAELLVAPRGNADEHSLNALLDQPENRPFARYIHPLPLDAAYRTISSTQIRQGTDTRIQDVPREVRDFMHRTRAYIPPTRLADGSEVDYYGERMQALENLLHSSGQLKAANAEK